MGNASSARPYHTSMAVDVRRGRLTPRRITCPGCPRLATGDWRMHVKGTSGGRPSTQAGRQASRRLSQPPRIPRPANHARECVIPPR